MLSFHDGEFIFTSHRGGGVCFKLPHHHLRLTTQSSPNQLGGRCAPRTCSDDYRKWWCPCEVPDHEILEVEIVQFVNKDNVALHTIVFPSTLLDSRKKSTMLHHLSTSEYMQV